MYDSTFGKRGRGDGPYADAIKTLFETTAKRLGYEANTSSMMGVSQADAHDATPPRGQLVLFQ